MMQKKTKIQIPASIPVFFLRERDSFVGYSPVLDLSTCGRTLEEARANFSEALDIFFEECTAMGTLEKVLESLGWEKKRGSKQWLPPVQVHEETIKLPEFAFA
jgi:predicted RNase H-like HicB family nuclease